MWTKGVSMHMKSAIIRLNKKTTQIYQRHSRNLWLNRHIGTFLKKKESTADLSNTKKPGRQQKWIEELFPC